MKMKSKLQKLNEGQSRGGSGKRISFSKNVLVNIGSRPPNKCFGSIDLSYCGPAGKLLSAALSSRFPKFLGSGEFQGECHTMAPVMPL